MFLDTLLKNKRALITGGGSGLGLAMAKRLASLGASVTICGRTEDKLKAAVKGLSNCSYKVCDVRDYKAVAKMISELSIDNPLDILINNAAGNFFCCSEDLSENAFKTVIDIVLQGSFNCSQHFGKSLIDAGTSGSIINILATYTDHGSAFVLPSACAKSGVAAMTKSLAFEWAQYGIRVNGISPGPIPTEGAWQRLMPKGWDDKYEQSLPTKRFGTKEEVADLVAFLLSDMAKHITGEIVTIDGGERLKGSHFNNFDDFVDRKSLKTIFSSLKS